MNNLTAFETIESGVRSYSRSWPTVFTRARGSTLWDEEGREYVDLFAGAGTLNYGHNHPTLKAALLEYLGEDNIVHGLDMATSAKRAFLEQFQETVLRPRGLDYVVQFPGPTGTNSVEAALKLARKVTGRLGMISFTNAFHGMTLGSLALTGNDMKRGGGGVPLGNATSMPYDGFLGPDTDSLEVLRSYLSAGGSGLDAPAAIVVETVQGEGGVNVAGFEFLRGLEQICRDFDCLFIVDDIQMGCGRTGRFFSFEAAGVKPDIVCLSKSISGYGLPMALTLFRRELDIWEPGEHNGTFRGNNPAFVTATTALREFWSADDLSQEVDRKARLVAAGLESLADAYPEANGTVRGRGLIQGIYCDVEGLAGQVARGAFERGVILETSGPNDEVLKLLPALTIKDEALDHGLEVIGESLETALMERGLRGRAMSMGGSR
ncbi:MAG: diaminobutyrate--2-oxoglutarate transaminase [Dehalococcoidia bacterium]